MLKFSLRMSRHEDVWGSGRKTPRILNLGTRRGWEITFTLRQLQPRGKRARSTH